QSQQGTERPQANARKASRPGPGIRKDPSPMREQRTDSVLPAQRPPGARVSPAERSLHARMAAYAMHARHDSRETSAPGRAAFRARFEGEVDPDGHLDPQARARRAEPGRPRPLP